MYIFFPHTPYVATHVSFCLKEKSDQAILSLSPQNISLYISLSPLK